MKIENRCSLGMHTDVWLISVLFVCGSFVVIFEFFGLIPSLNLILSFFFF